MHVENSLLISMPGDETLIYDLQQNNLSKRKAEIDLFNKYSYFIREGMNKYSLIEEDAFDAYSDTILQAIDNITKNVFEHKSSIKTYLYRIFSNKCVDLLRKKTTNKNSIHVTASITDMLLMISDGAKTVIEILVDKTDKAILKIKLEQLGENCKQILLLFADGITDKEIAITMKYKSADVVKISRLRCLDKLRQLYIN